MGRKSLYKTDSFQGRDFLWHAWKDEKLFVVLTNEQAKTIMNEDGYTMRKKERSVRVFMVREILKLGNPELYKVSAPVTREDASLLPGWIQDLHDTLLDDCMSFPGLMVRVERYRHAVITYLDENLKPQSMELAGDYAELLQHEYDHLDGILATMRAVDNQSFFLGQMKREIEK